MTPNTPAFGADGYRDDAPFSGKIFFAAAVGLLLGALPFEPSRSQVDADIAAGAAILQSSPLFAECGLDAGAPCQIGALSARAVGPTFVIYKDGLDVASVVAGKFYVDSSLNDAERLRIRTTFAKAMAR